MRASRRKLTYGGMDYRCRLSLHFAFFILPCSHFMRFFCMILLFLCLRRIVCYVRRFLLRDSVQLQLSAWRRAECSRESFYFTLRAKITFDFNSPLLAENLISNGPKIPTNKNLPRILECVWVMRHLTLGLN